MKNLLIALGLILAINLSSQQDNIKISFKRENQAKKQAQRLNIHYRALVTNDKGEKTIISKWYYECGGRYCVDIIPGDIDLTYGHFENRLTIKKRHYKHIINPDPIGFGYDIYMLKYNKFKLFKKK